MKIDTISALGERLLRLYNDIETGAVELKTAVELNNTAGKIVSAYKTQLAYHALRGEAPVMPFLAAAEIEKTKPLLTSNATTETTQDAGK